MTSSTPVPDDIPDLADPGVKIVRHSFGGGSALFIVLGLFTMGALVTYKLSMDGNPALMPEEPASAAPASSGAADAKQTAESEASLTDAAEMELVPLQDKPEDEAKIHEAIDGAFRALDPQDANTMDMFLSRYGNSPYAVEKGYVETVRKAVTTLEQQDAEEERKRKKEQQAVPWDMGVEPPKGQD
jgi:hypothetical protein